MAQLGFLAGRCRPDEQDGQRIPHDQLAEGQVPPLADRGGTHGPWDGWTSAVGCAILGRMALSGDELAQELHRRAGLKSRREPLEFHQAIAHVIDTFSLKLTIQNFQDHRGLVLEDLNGRSVAFYDVGTQDEYARSEVEAYSSILVLVEDGMVLGWVPQDQVTVADEHVFSLNVRSLLPMPKVFDFARSCPHLTVFGGWWDREAKGWECFGCGHLVYDHTASSG